MSVRKGWKFTISTTKPDELDKIIRLNKEYLKYSFYESEIIGYIILYISARASKFDYIDAIWEPSTMKEIRDSKRNLRALPRDVDSPTRRSLALSVKICSA